MAWNSRWRRFQNFCTDFFLNLFYANWLIKNIPSKNAHLSIFFEIWKNGGQNIPCKKRGPVWTMVQKANLGPKMTTCVNVPKTR
jgi:hypothetical protein